MSPAGGSGAYDNMAADSHTELMLSLHLHSRCNLRTQQTSIAWMDITSTVIFEHLSTGMRLLPITTSRIQSLASYCIGFTYLSFAWVGVNAGKFFCLIGPGACRSEPDYHALHKYPSTAWRRKFAKCSTSFSSERGASLSQQAFRQATETVDNAPCVESG